MIVPHKVRSRVRWRGRLLTWHRHPRRHPQQTRPPSRQGRPRCLLAESPRVCRLRRRPRHSVAPALTCAVSLTCPSFFPFLAPPLPLLLPRFAIRRRYNSLSCRGGNTGNGNGGTPRAVRSSRACGTTRFATPRRSGGSRRSGHAERASRGGEGGTGATVVAAATATATAITAAAAAAAAVAVAVGARR